MRQKVEEETQLRQELDQKVVKMNQLLTTGQEALAQEKKTVELLKQQMASSSPQTPIKVSSINSTFVMPIGIDFTKGNLMYLVVDDS